MEAYYNPSTVGSCSNVILYNLQSCIKKNINHFYFVFSGKARSECTIPVVLRGSWFSWENRQVETELNANEMHRNSDRNFFCEDIKEDYHVNYTLVFSHPSDNCYHCVKFLIRTVNVLDKIESK